MIQMNKTKLLLKPCQSGKTFHVLNTLVEIFRSGKERTINIIFCDNSLLQTMQTTKRLDNKEELDTFKDDNGNLNIVLSSKSKCKSIGDLSWAISKNHISNVVCCNNGAQMKKINELIFSELYSSYTFNIFIDEADRFIKKNKKFITEWDTSDNVQEIMLMTATSDYLYTVYKEIEVIDLQESVDLKLYHRFVDCSFRLWNIDCKPVAYAKSVLENNNDILNTGQVWFIPGDTTRKSHDEIEKILLSMNIAVLKINGLAKTLSHKGKVIDLTKWVEKGEKVFDTKEMSVWLSMMYKKYSLQNEVLAITGNLCVGRGITISSKDVMITHAIIPSYQTASAQYQTAGRLCGNNKEFENYKKPIVFCSKSTQMSVIEMENKALRIPEIAYETGDKIFTKQDYKMGGKEKAISGVPVKVELSKEAMALIYKHKKTTGIGIKQSIVQEIKRSIFHNKNVDFNIDKYNLKHIQRLNSCNDNGNGASKYCHKQFHRAYKFQQPQKPDDNCKQKGWYNILVIMDDIPHLSKMGIKKGYGYITYIPL
jgi:hypothetical protein